MKVHDVNEQADKLGLPGEQKSAILVLVDLRTESEMEKALLRFEAAINSLKSDMDAEFMSIDSKFTVIESNIESKFAGIDAKFSAMNSKLNFLLWFIGALTALLALVKFIGMVY